MFLKQIKAERKGAIKNRERGRKFSVDQSLFPHVCFHCLQRSMCKNERDLKAPNSFFEEKFNKTEMREEKWRQGKKRKSKETVVHHQYEQKLRLLTKKL